MKLANAAPEMWQALEVGQIDLILLDIMLPGTSGIDLCRQVRQKSSVPIIFISAKGSEVDRVVGLELKPTTISPSRSARASWLRASAPSCVAAAWRIRRASVRPESWVSTVGLRTCLAAS